MRYIAWAALALTACSGSGGPDDGGPTPPGEESRACAAPGPFESVTPAEEWEQTTSADGWRVLQYFPDAPRGLVFYFHGTGGHATDVKYVEVTREIDTLTRAGFAFVSTESEDRDPEMAQWDTADEDWSTNPDLVRLDAIREALIADGRITESTPIFTDGFSDGGAMSGFFSGLALDRGWPVRAAAIHSSGGAAPSSIPQIWAVAENDKDDIPEHAEGSYEAVVAAGGVAEFHASVEGPLDPQQFLRIPRYDQASADQAFADLVDYGIVDEDGVRLIDLDTQLESSLDLFESRSRVQQDWEVSSELRVVWATHRFDSQFTQDVCELFADAL